MSSVFSRFSKIQALKLLPSFAARFLTLAFKSSGILSGVIGVFILLMYIHITTYASKS